MKILSKSNYRVRLNVNMDITDSISFYFNFGKDYHFVLRLKQHFFDKARFFLMNRVNPAIVDWRRKEVETCARRSLSFESFLDKITSFPLTPYCIEHSKGQNKKYLEEYKHFEMLFGLWTGARDFMMKAKAIVLPKRDFNYKLKLVSNDDC